MTPRLPAAPHPTAAPPSAVPHNVPFALSSFVGREREQRDLTRAVAGARLVTVTGPGGGGKTRLAREVAAAFAAGVPVDDVTGDVTGEALGDERIAGGRGGPDRTAALFPDGVWWLELAPLADAAQVPQAAAAVLGVRPAPGRDATEAVAEALHGRRTLLVFDNCEHVVEAAAALGERLLRAAPGLTVLATSREPLAVEGEAAWMLPPLATPPAAAGTAILLGYEAVRLFVARVRAAHPAFALADANAPAVAAICARLDGLPLALELAAAAVPVLGVEQVAARLGDLFGLLTRGRRTALPRHKTLRALLDWSYQLLDAEQRALLARFAVFRGGVTLDAVEAVCGADPRRDGALAGPPGMLLPRERVVPALGRLVEHSLVDMREQGGETRYRLLETVRQYGLARLAEDPADERRARVRHAAWVEALAAAAEPHFWGAGRGRTVARVERDVDEIRAALTWAGGPDGDPMTAVRIAGALGWFWYSGVPWAEARAWTGAALAAADGQGVPDAARPACDQAALASLLYPIAGLAYFGGESDRLLPYAERALALWDAVDTAVAADPALGDALRARAARGRAFMLQIAGLAYGFRGEADAALRAADASVATAHAAGDAWLHAVVRTRRGRIQATVGRSADVVLADYTNAVQLLRAVGETWFLSLALQGMAEAALDAGDLAAAVAHARESVAVLRDEPDPFFVSRALETLAAVAVTVRSPATAGAAAPTPARATVAAELLGAAAGLRAGGRGEVLGVDRDRHTVTLAAARAGAGDAAFAAAWAAGEAGDLERAFSLVASADVVDAVPAGVVPSARPGAAASTGGPPALAVLVLGPLVVARAGVPLGAGERPAGKIGELLVLLALHPDGLTKEQIGLALWPDASATSVRNLFHVALHHLRRTLGGADRNAARTWVTFADGQYRLARVATGGDGVNATLDCDVDAVRAAVDALRRAERHRDPLDPAALDAAARALARVRGELGAGLAAGDWIAEHQQALRAGWADGMHALARQHARAGRHAAAAEVLEALVARDPLREGAHRDLMLLWAASGERARALRHYDTLAELLRRDVGAAPARETRAVIERIRQHL